MSRARTRAATTYRGGSVMDMISLPKHTVDLILEVLKSYDIEERKTYQAALKEAGEVKFWNDVPAPNDFMSAKTLENLNHNLQDHVQKNNTELAALNIGCSLADTPKYDFFVTDGEGNTMLEGVDEMTAREYAMSREGFSIGR
jgi:hypothetical protein